MKEGGREGRCREGEGNALRGCGASLLREFLCPTVSSTKPTRLSAYESQNKVREGGGCKQTINFRKVHPYPLSLPAPLETTPPKVQPAPPRLQLRVKTLGDSVSRPVAGHRAPTETRPKGGRNCPPPLPELVRTRGTGTGIRC